MRTIDYSFIKDELEKEGYILLTKEDEYDNASTTRLHIKCSCGSEFHRTWAKFKSGQTCSVCKDKETKLKTYYYRKSIIENEGYKVTNVFTSAKDMIHLVCPNGHDCIINWNNFKGGKRCKKCNNKSKAFDFEYVKNYLHEYNILLLDDEYYNQRQKLNLKCTKCDATFMATFHNIKNNGAEIKCPNCREKNKQEKLKNNLLQIGVTPLETIMNQNQDIQIICKHNHRFHSTYNKLLERNGTCPICSTSKGEGIIADYLMQHNILFEREFKFDDCCYKYRLKFDFYLPTLNSVIEYNGIQHYEPVKHFGGEDAFKIRQIKDNIKKEYCNLNNINILVIPYWEYDNIENILNRFCFQRLSLK